MADDTRMRKIGIRNFALAAGVVAAFVAMVALVTRMHTKEISRPTGEEDTWEESLGI